MNMAQLTVVLAILLSAEFTFFLFLETLFFDRLKPMASIVMFISVFFVIFIALLNMMLSLINYIV